jgi:hypothetical protein
MRTIKRLTDHTPDNFGYAEYKLVCDADAQEVIDRLAAYEDSGLSPEQVQELVKIKTVVFENEKLNSAFEWAINQQYQSVAAQYAKTLSESIKQIREICESDD